MTDQVHGGWGEGVYEFNCLKVYSCLVNMLGQF